VNSRFFSLIFKSLASLRLTVLCLAFALVLVILGTLAQVNEGLYQAQTRYFRSFFIWWTPSTSGLHLPVLPGGYTVGTVLLANLIAAHLKRFGVTRKKLGILMIHSGLIVLLLGQLLTDLLSRESTMRLTRGGSANYSEDAYRHELAIVDRTDPKHDLVVAIQESALTQTSEIRPAKLPMAVRIKAFWPNAAFFGQPTNGAEKVLVTQGAGTESVYLLPRPLVVSGDLRNMPAAVVELIAPNGSLGTWLVSTLASAAQPFTWQDRQYEVALRAMRHYQPFWITLLDLRHDVYKGTDIPRNFSSRVRIQNPQTAEDREVLIYMNNPLRYHGETYCQYQMEKTSDLSVLQVVRNPSWLTPYLSCVLIGLGLVVQFMTHLVRFIRKSDVRVAIAEPPRLADRPAGVRGNGPSKIQATGILRLARGSRISELVPWAILGLFLLYVAEAAFRPGRSPAGLDLAGFGRLPVLLNGRVQPFDSVARNSLLQIRSTATVPLEQKKTAKFWEHPRKLSSTEWLLEVMTMPEVADERKIFLVHHPELLGELDLKPRAGSGLNYFSFKELTPKLAEIGKQAHRIDEVKAENRSSAERQLLKLQNALLIYQRLKNSLQPNDLLQAEAGGRPIHYDFPGSLARYQASLVAAIASEKARQQGQEFDTNALSVARQFVQPFEMVARAALPMVVPPAGPARSRDGWENIGASLLGSLRTGQVAPAVAHFGAISSAFAQGKPAAFNRAVADYRQWLGGHGLLPELGKGRYEFFYNQFQPFLKATAIYIAAFILGCGFWFNRSNLLYRSAAVLLGLAFTLHTTGLLSRMILEGRPPVTNLYSSAIFVGWGAACLGIAVEWFHRNGIGMATAAFVGLVTQIIAHNLGLGGDTMEMMRAVLDNNFWLATHVVVITLGYSSMFVAGFVAAAYLLLGVLTRRLSPGAAGTLDRMVYGVVCFATLFSFVGTVLGGIWADQSWGRFWGWDPKENGALLIVLWNALWLHVRWGRLAGPQAQMALAVGGNIITSLSWFGVNMLGVGLHSYGFLDAAFQWLMLFAASQLAIIGLSFLPQRCSLSTRTNLAGAKPRADKTASVAAIHPKSAAAGS
jgi:ABC-type transport system involved in cytochrome c biogenesis permease subunit